MWFKSVGSNGASTSARRTAPSILSEGFRIDGDIVCEGEVHISGTLIGNLTASRVTVGEGGSVNGSVEAETAVVNGSIQGRLVAVNVVLGRSAHVTADVVYCSMRIEPGAVFEGYSRRVDREHMPDGEMKQLMPAIKSLRNGADHAEIVAPAEAEH
jgi:cytoskeletal protein CcmA (bactofilin family)